jgi:hypothetical protein
MANETEGTGFSQEYVEKLRKEAADWRTKYRDLESHQQSTEVQAEFARRGITADSSWVKLSEGMKVSDAVDDLVTRYPHLAPAQNGNTNLPQPSLPTNTPQVLRGTTSNTNLPTNPTQGRSLTEIQKDPVARSQLRERYRQLIQQSSRQTNGE